MTLSHAVRRYPQHGYILATNSSTSKDRADGATRAGRRFLRLPADLGEGDRHRRPMVLMYADQYGAADPRVELFAAPDGVGAA